MLSANVPRGQKIVGEISDGWITTGGGASVPRGLPRVMESARAAGNSFDRAGGDGVKPYVTALASACVLRDGESLSSERVIRNVGPTLTAGVHAMWERAYGPGSNLGMEDADLAGEYDRYIREYGDKRPQPTPDDRRYLDVHEGHYVYLKEGEERFVSSEMVARSLTGTGQVVENEPSKKEDRPSILAAFISITPSAHGRLKG